MKDLSGTYYSEPNYICFIKKQPEGSFKEYVLESKIEKRAISDSVWTLHEYILCPLYKTKRVTLKEFLPNYPFRPDLNSFNEDYFRLATEEESAIKRSPLYQAMREDS